MTRPRPRVIGLESARPAIRGYDREMLKWAVTVSLVAAYGCKGSGGDNKAAYEKASALVNRAVKELKGASARIMTVPDTADLSTFPTLAQHCVQATETAQQLGVLATEKDAGISLLGKVVNNFVEVTDTACKDITYAQAADCWKACSTEWSHFEAALVQFAGSAKTAGVTVDPLE